MALKNPPWHVAGTDVKPPDAASKRSGYGMSKTGFVVHEAFILRLTAWRLLYLECRQARHIAGTGG